MKGFRVQALPAKLRPQTTPTVTVGACGLQGRRVCGDFVSWGGGGLGFRV